MIGEGVFTQDGAEWKSSRELLRKQFARMQYQNLEGFRGPVENLVNKLKSSAGVVDLQPFFYRLTLVTTITMILGQPLEIFDHEIGDQFSRAFDKASLITATRVRLGDLYFLYAPKGFFKSCTTVKQYLYQFVKDALGQEALSQKNEAQDPNEMSFIANLYTAYRDLGLTRDQVTNVLIAGRDTTAATLSYAMWVETRKFVSRLTMNHRRLLVQNPTVLMKLREEVIAVAGNDKDVTRSHIQRMTYLQQVLKESGLPSELYRILLSSFRSASALPSSATELSFLQEDNYSATGRWRGWTISHPSPKRYAGCVFCISSAETGGFIWPRSFDLST